MDGGDGDEYCEGDGVEKRDGDVVPVGLSVYFPSICDNRVSNLLQSERSYCFSRWVDSTRSCTDLMRRKPRSTEH